MEVAYPPWTCLHHDTVFSYIWPYVCYFRQCLLFLVLPLVLHFLYALPVGAEGCCLLLLKSSLLQEEEAQLPSASSDKANVALPIIRVELSPVYLCLPYWKAQTGQVLST